MPKVLTVPEVAKELRLSPDTVKKLLNEGRLKGVRTGHYSGEWWQDAHHYVPSDTDEVLKLIDETLK